MNSEEKKLIEILNILLKDNDKKLESLEQLSDFNYIADLIKIM